MSAINGINSGATASAQPGNEWIIVEEDIFRGSPPLPDLRQPAPSLIERVHQEQGPSNIERFFRRLFGIGTKETTSSQPKPQLTQEQTARIDDVKNKFSRAIGIYSIRRGFPEETLRQDLDKLISILETELSQGSEKIAITSLPPQIKQLFIVLEDGQPKGAQADVPDLFEGTLGAEKYTVGSALIQRRPAAAMAPAATSKLPTPKASSAVSALPKAPALPAAHAHNIQFTPAAASYAPPASSDSGYSASYEEVSSNPFAGLRRVYDDNGRMTVLDENDNEVDVSKRFPQSEEQGIRSTPRYLGVDAADGSEYYP